MSVRIGFLRAVNLGRRRVAMSRLAAVCEGLGYSDVWTFVNSGNVVFDAIGRRASVEAAMERALEEELGFECTTFVRTAQQLTATLDARPFTLAPGGTHFVTFLKKAPGATVAQRLEGLSNDFDTLIVRGADVHWRMRGKSTDSRLGSRDWETILGPLSSTSRNVTMLTRLVTKIDAAERPRGRPRLSRG
ncbi:DUF1697 domain-containing protein [Intrasporangium chromatireducens]|nr:DUF1697 domain-containing protein [Intrasporangium chromatireducens]